MKDDSMSEKDRIRVWVGRGYQGICMGHRRATNRST